jgi:hypothetical protein
MTNYEKIDSCIDCTKHWLESEALESEAEE